MSQIVTKKEHIDEHKSRISGRLVTLTTRRFGMHRRPAPTQATALIINNGKPTENVARTDTAHDGDSEPIKVHISEGFDVAEAVPEH